MVAGPSESGTPVPHGTGVLGRVVDSGGRPVAMATLSATRDPAAPDPAGSDPAGAGPVRQEANITGVDGDYFLPLPPGRWTVTVAAVGRPPLSWPVEVPSEGQARHDVTLR